MKLYETKFAFNTSSSRSLRFLGLRFSISPILKSIISFLRKYFPSFRLFCVSKKKKESSLWKLFKKPEILFKLTITEPKFWNFSWTNLMKILHFWWIVSMIQHLLRGLTGWSVLFCNNCSSFFQLRSAAKAQWRKKLTLQPKFFRKIEAILFWMR